MGPDMPLKPTKNHQFNTRSKRKDVECNDTFNPFEERSVENPTTDNETLIHLLKASLGSGILQMPSAFRCLGLGMGIFMTMLVGFVCTYCAYILVKSAHKLYYKTKKTSMSYGEVAQSALEKGPASFRKFGKSLRLVIDVCLFLAYFVTCSAYVYIISKNILEIFQGLSVDVHIRTIMAVLLVPVIIFSFIPDLKYLAPFSMFANFLMGIALFLIFGWLTYQITQTGVSPHWQFIGNVSLNATGSPVYSSWYVQLPKFLYITIFAIEAIGVIMPLENKMATPKNFVGSFGVLSKGMTVVTFIYIALGALGYIWNSTTTTDLVTEDIQIKVSSYDPITIIGYIVKTSVALAVFFTFTLQFFVCLETIWRCLKYFSPTAGTKANYVLRAVLVLISVIIAMVVPKLGPLVGFIGAVCFSILGLLVPVIIESITYWEDDSSQYKILRTIKNVIIGVVSILILIFGALEACKGFSG